MEKGKSRPLFFPIPFSVSTYRASFFSLSSVSLSTLCKWERSKERQTFFQASECYISLGCWVHEHTVSFAGGAKREQMQGRSCFFFFFFFFSVVVDCEQALHLGYILKSSRARGTLASLAQIGELARRLPWLQKLAIITLLLFYALSGYAKHRSLRS